MSYSVSSAIHRTLYDVQLRLGQQVRIIGGKSVFNVTIAHVSVRCGPLN